MIPLANFGMIAAEQEGLREMFVRSGVQFSAGS
jgi:hypothetical protein